MKRALALAIALVATACGTANDAATTKASDSINAVDYERTLFPIQGEISQVQVHGAVPPAHGIWTEVSVEFLVPCTNRFEGASLAYDYAADGKVKLFVSAYASASTKRGELVCQAFSHESASLTIPGIVDQESIQLVHLNTKAVGIPNDTAQISSVDNFKIVGTESLCPLNAICAKNGTVVTVAMTLNSCVNSLGPVAYAVEQTLEKGQPLSATLTINAIEFHSENAPNVRCFAPHVVTTRISLPNVYGTADTINLRVVQ